MAGGHDPSTNDRPFFCQPQNKSTPFLGIRTVMDTQPSLAQSLFEALLVVSLLIGTTWFWLAL